MNINKLVFRNFKTLENVSFEPGRVNVFIGANGSGKTTVLEAIGLLCAAMTDRIDNSSMQRKGIRLSVPGLYKSAFSDLKRKAPTINFDVSWSQNEKNYLGAEKRPGALKKNKAGKSVHYKINRRPSQSKKNSARSQAQIKRREHEKSSVRAKVEHVFAVVKLQLRFRKTRYRGLQKQIAKMNIMFALANLILADRPCLAA